MIFQAPILALLLVSALASVTVLWSAWFGLRVLRHWDLASGSRAQLKMERLTHLVSTLFAFIMIVELAALFLFVFNADRMATIFVGAMCAVGTLNVNAYGFPALYLKISVFFAAALWLILDHADRSARDYPLTRVKYGLVIAIAPLVLAAGLVELAYFLNLRADVITSCCSKMFTPAKADIAAEMSSLSPDIALGLLAGAGVFVVLTGASSLAFGRGNRLHALAGAVFFVAALTAIVSVISSYVYEHPHHHCPFCLLKPEYSYFGYALFVPLFVGTALALGAGALQPFARIESLSSMLPVMIRQHIIMSLAAFAFFACAVIWAITASRLILIG